MVRRSPGETDGLLSPNAPGRFDAGLAQRHDHSFVFSPCLLPTPLPLPIRRSA
jgi:hypothetical protein